MNINEQITIFFYSILSKFKLFENCSQTFWKFRIRGSSFLHAPSIRSAFVARKLFDWHKQRPSRFFLNFVYYICIRKYKIAVY